MQEDTSDKCTSIPSFRAYHTRIDCTSCTCVQLSGVACVNTAGIFLVSLPLDLAMSMELVGHQLTTVHVQQNGWLVRDALVVSSGCDHWLHQTVCCFCQKQTTFVQLLGTLVVFPGRIVHVPQNKCSIDNEVK